MAMKKDKKKNGKKAGKKKSVNVEQAVGMGIEDMLDRVRREERIAVFQDLLDTAVTGEKPVTPELLQSLIDQEQLALVPAAPDPNQKAA